jgi:hypothetical protein
MMPVCLPIGAKTGSLGIGPLYTALFIMRALAVGKIFFGEVHPKVAAWTFSPSRIQLDEMPT